MSSTRCTLVPVAELASGCIDHGGMGRHYVRVHLIPPMNNPWIKRFAVLAIMFGFYGIGIAAGRDQALLAHHNHPACHPNLKP